MKKLLALTLMLIVLLLCAAAFADGEQKSGLFTYKLKGNGTALITEFDWEKNGNQDVYVPRMLDGYTVTEIGDSAFSANWLKLDYSWKSNHASELAVILPDTIKVIGEKAFFSCNQIATLNIPSSVQIIGDGAFSNTYMKCSVASSNEYFATINSVLYNKKTKSLLYCPKGIVRYDNPLIIPDGIIKICSYAFYNYDGWKINSNYVVISLPKTIKEIGDYAFADFGELGQFSIPNSVEQIGNYAFRRCGFSSPELHRNGLYL